jgi:DNA-directed RNA polymerase subunit RPC12/RpoP
MERRLIRLESQGRPAGCPHCSRLPLLRFVLPWEETQPLTRCPECGREPGGTTIILTIAIPPLPPSGAPS